MAQSSSFMIRAADGWPLKLHHIPAVSDSRGVVLMTHAMMADHRSLDKPAGKGFGSFFASRGWEVYLADYRGHGSSETSDANESSWDYHELVRFDFPVMVETLRSRHPDLKLCAAGQSLGGHVSVASHGAGYLENPPDMYLLLSTNIWKPSLDSSFFRRALKTWNLAVFQGATQVLGKFPAKALGLGTADAALQYVRDLCGFWWRDSWGNESEGVDYAAGLKNIESPILSVVGRGDRLMAHHSSAEAWAKLFDPGLCTFWSVGRGDHRLSFDPAHMSITTDPRARSLWAAMEYFVSDRLEISQEVGPRRGDDGR